MARDYAARNKRPARHKGGVPGWVWMLAGLSAGLAVAAFVYISRPAQPLRGSAAQAPQRGEGAREVERESVEIPPREKPRFTFYELLPSQEVLVPSQEAPKPGTSAPQPGSATPADRNAPAGEVYIIQVASYRSQDEAEQQKAMLALLGVESRIEKVTIDNRDTYYRVRVGPERDASRARALLAQLQANGVNGMLVKVK